MQATYTRGPRSFIAGVELEKYRRVKIKAGTTTTPPEVVYADAGEACIGLTATFAKLGGTVTVRGLTDSGTFIAVAADSFAVGADLYGAVDGKVSDTPNGTVQFKALQAAGANGDEAEMIVHPFVSTEAASVSIGDAGAHTSQTTVEGALQELYSQIDTAKKTLAISLGALMLSDGSALTKFVSEDAGSCGFSREGGKELVLRFNNHATPPKVGFSVPMPQDLDGSRPVEIHWLAAMSGAADTPALEHECYFGAGDTDCAGADDEVDGGAALTEYSAAIAAADVPDVMPAVLSVFFGPKAGELGTDDLLVYGVWLEYQQAKLS